MTKSYKIPAIELTQHGKKIYIFAAKSSILWDFLKINEREKDKDEGYQRAFSKTRGQDIKNYIIEKGVIAPSLIISLRDTTFDPKTKMLIIPKKDDAGWVIDGQHRLQGANLAHRDGVEIEMSVVAFIDIDEEREIEQFITINREAKKVPTSLYLDLLKKLPSTKNEKTRLEERATEIARDLKDNPDSVFYNKIIFVGSPKPNKEISLTNFVRKIMPLIKPGGILEHKTHMEIVKILNNYFGALKITYPTEFQGTTQFFWGTLGFGAAINFFNTLFNHTLQTYNTFRIDDIVKSLEVIEDLNFDALKQKGTGSKAEIEAGKELVNEFMYALEDLGKGSQLVL